MLIQATDGWFYKNPSFIGDRVVVHGLTLSVKGSRSLGVSLLRALEIKGRLTGGEECTAIFGSGYGPGTQFQIALTEPIPVPRQYDCKTPEPASGEDCWGFRSLFVEDELVDHLTGRIKLPVLGRALLGDWVANDTLVKRRLYKQYPHLRELKSGTGRLAVLWRNNAIQDLS